MMGDTNPSRTDFVIRDGESVFELSADPPTPRRIFNMIDNVVEEYVNLQMFPETDMTDEAHDHSVSEIASISPGAFFDPSTQQTVRYTALDELIRYYDSEAEFVDVSLDGDEKLDSDANIDSITELHSDTDFDSDENPETDADEDISDVSSIESFEISTFQPLKVTFYDAQQQQQVSYIALDELLNIDQNEIIP